MPVAFSPSSPSAATGAGVTLNTSCHPSVIHLTTLQESTCTATVQNNALQAASVNLSTTWADNLTFRSATGGATRTGSKTVTAPTQTLAAQQPPSPQIAPGNSPAGYLDLALFGISLKSMGDETISNFNVPPFVYDGQTYSQVGVVSDGYLVVGGGSGSDINSNPQHFPDPTPPNNVLAPLWSDLDGGAGSIAGQGLRIGVLTDGVHNWLVVQWNTHVFGALAHLETFQVWIGLNGTQDISYAYDPSHPPTDPGLPFNIGAENAAGTAGSNFAGLPSGDLVVNSLAGAPGGSFSYSVNLRGNQVLPDNAASTVETDMTTSISRDTAVSTSTIQVVR
jgi:hypothetical protein